MIRFLFLALLLNLSALLFAEDTIVSVNVASPRPIQDGIGLAMLGGNRARSAEEWEKILSLLSSMVLTGARAPNGQIWILDGHHRWIKYFMAAKGLDRVAQTQMKVKITKDFQGQSWEDFYAAIESKVYLRKSIREKNIPFSEKVKSLPANAEALLARDVPGRSVVGTVFNKLKIAGSWFKECVEFFVAEAMEARGFIFEPGQELNPEVLSRAENMLKDPAVFAATEALLLNSADAQKLHKAVYKSAPPVESYSLNCPQLFSR